jgi:hypothetical protein
LLSVTDGLLSNTKLCNAKRPKLSNATFKFNVLTMLGKGLYLDQGGASIVLIRHRRKRERKSTKLTTFLPTVTCTRSPYFHVYTLFTSVCFE